MAPGRRAALTVAALAVVAALRLPYLGSPTYILDGDEAVLGIMARRMAAGAEWPVYFAGQSYGLAIFETLPAALAFRVVGEGPYVLALAILAVFLAGLVPLSRALARLSGSWVWGLLLTVAFALLPTWIVWSMKARGLYVSGFLLTACALALLTRPTLGKWGHVGLGVLLGGVVLVQPFWLFAALPFLATGNRSARDMIATGGAAGAVLVAALVIGPRGEAFWQPRVFGGFLPAQLIVLPRVLMSTFAGREVPHQPGTLAMLVGVVATLTYSVCLVGIALEALRRRSEQALAAGVAMVLCILHVVVLAVWVPRYFLPATLAFVVAAATWLGARQVRPRGGPLAASVAVIALLAFTALRIGRLPPDSSLNAVSAQEDMAELVAGLERDGVRGVYALPGHTQWQILFYGGERIPARGRSATDRYPEFPLAVRDAQRAGAPLSFVADIRQLRAEVPAVDSFPGYRVGERYLRLDDPTPLLLAGLGFELEP